MNKMGHRQNKQCPTDSHKSRENHSIRISNRRRKHGHPFMKVTNSRKRTAN
uniref:Uncharacterized protein n=1 Tax=Rhizophora mucronata TaxID=61149 RepID=A0A2P2N3X6_RHIMU